mmetsp:Transcript_44100/g.127543  ORF Transcript_44100/g.127543 Transcript_44100/m.127543 type:complete len:428 (+) Transcript_44100:12-1295(+)
MLTFYSIARARSIMAVATWRFECFWFLVSMAYPGALGISLQDLATSNLQGGASPQSKTIALSARSSFPQDAGTLSPGCHALQRFVVSNNEDEVRQACESIATTVQQHLDNKDLAATCLSLVQPILNDPQRGPWLAKTRVQEAIMEFVKRYADDREVQWNAVFLVGGGYGVPQAVTLRTSQLGGFTHLFSVIKHFDSDVEMQMQTWRSLSDPSYTVSGANTIANEGGTYEGIRFMVQQMEAHTDGHQAVGAQDHLDLLYEIMQVAGGILSMNRREYAPVFWQEGFTSQIVHAMEVEQDLRGTQDVACKCMSRLAAEVRPAAVDLMDRGAVELMKNAMDTFHDYDATPFVMGHTLGNEYPVVPNCAQTLKAMAVAAPKKAKMLMIQAGLEGTLASVRPDMLSGETLIDGFFQGLQVRSDVSYLLKFIRE